MTETWPPGRPMHRAVRRLVIHHSATEDSGTLSWGAIERHHVQTNGWDAVAYHAGAELVRDTFQVLLGRPTDRTGAHTPGRAADGIRWNHCTLGFCFVGDYDAEEPPLGLLEIAARRWIVPQLKQHQLTPAAICGHRDLASKSCPGTLFDLDRLRGLCRSILLEV